MTRIISIEDTIDLEQLENALLNEVKTVFNSENFLRGCKIESKIEFHTSRSTVFNCETLPITSFLAEIETEEDDYLSTYNELKTRISKIDQSSVFFNSVGATSVSRIVSSVGENIQDSVRQTKSFKDMLSNMQEKMTPSHSEAELFFFLENTIGDHIAGILESRALTLSKRYTPMEIVLEAYRIGLFPFGWDKRTKTLQCVNPIDFLEAK